MLQQNRWQEQRAPYDAIQQPALCDLSSRNFAKFTCYILYPNNRLKGSILGLGLDESHLFAGSWSQDLPASLDQFGLDEGLGASGARPGCELDRVEHQVRFLRLALLSCGDFDDAVYQASAAWKVIIGDMPLSLLSPSL